MQLSVSIYYMLYYTCLRFNTVVAARKGSKDYSKNTFEDIWL